jgi:sugar lactone lactonase YvrE
MAICAIAAIGTPALAGVSTINPKAAYPEGPLWHDGKLFYVEYSGNTITTWDGKANLQFWKQEGCGPSGLVDLPGGRLMVTCYDSNTLVEVGADGKTERTIAADSAGKPFLGPNDLGKDAKGGIYFSASGVYDVKAPIQGMIYYVAPDGRIAPVADTIHYSNGLAVSADGKTLLCSEMLAGRILAFEIKPDGSLGARKVFARLQDIAPMTPGADAYNGPDGLKVGSDGLIYVAQNGSGRVLVVDQDAKLVRMVEVPARYVTNINFGPTVDTLYITSTIDEWNAPYPGEVYEATR